MKTKLIVTDVTRMRRPDVCVAGYMQDGREYICVRPRLRGQVSIPEKWLHQPNGVIAPFSIIEMNLIEAEPQPPHMEDFTAAWGVQLCGTIDQATERRSILDAISKRSVTEVFGGHQQEADEGGYFVPVGSRCPSLGTIKVEEPRIYFGMAKYERSGDPWEYKIQFDGGDGVTYKLRITDLATRRYLHFLRREQGMTDYQVARHLTHQLADADAVYLRLGLTRHWPRFPNRCYLQVTGIYSFPDYLDGRTHADFPEDYG